LCTPHLSSIFRLNVFVHATSQFVYSLIVGKNAIYPLSRFIWLVKICTQRNTPLIVMHNCRCFPDIMHHAGASLTKCFCCSGPRVPRRIRSATNQLYVKGVFSVLCVHIIPILEKLSLLCITLILYIPYISNKYRYVRRIVQISTPKQATSRRTGINSSFKSIMNKTKLSTPPAL
jgi:hypothetical protein